MTIIKNDLPILEYDTEKEAILKPSRYGYHFPEKAIMAFLGDEVDDYALSHEATVIVEYETVTTYFPVYKIIYAGEEVALIRTPVGAAPAAQILDFLIGADVKKVIAIGSCGALIDLPENKWLIATEALRDEGTSYHYLPAMRSIKLDEAVISKIEEMFTEQNLEFEPCKTWTTDAFYRETADLVNYRVAEGCQVVEMECSALAAVAEFREISFGQILFTADTLAESENYDARDWGGEAFKAGLELALAAVSKL